jgi:hypothetical protein
MAVLPTSEERGKSPFAEVFFTPGPAMSYARFFRERFENKGLTPDDESSRFVKTRGGLGGLISLAASRSQCRKRLFDSKSPRRISAG